MTYLEPFEEGEFKEESFKVGDFEEWEFALDDFEKNPEEKEKPTIQKENDELIAFMILL